MDILYYYYYYIHVSGILYNDCSRYEIYKKVPCNFQMKSFHSKYVVSQTEGCCFCSHVNHNLVQVLTAHIYEYRQLLWRCLLMCFFCSRLRIFLFRALTHLLLVWREKIVLEYFLYLYLYSP